MSGPQEGTPNGVDRLDDILDGLSLWQEHRPQTAEDWVGVAERCLADPEFDRSKSSVMFAALVTAVEQRNAALARLDSGASRSGTDTAEENT